MNFDYGSLATNITEARLSPFLMFPGVDVAWSIRIDGTGTLSATSMALYENGQDVSGTKLSGSLSVSGRVIKCKTITGHIGGTRLRAFLYFTDDGVSEVREFTVIVPRLGEKPSNYPGALDIYRAMESPLMIYPGQSQPYELIIDGQGTIGASPTMNVYKKYTDDSATVLSGSMLVTGRTITLKTIGSLSGGSEYIGYVFFTDKGKSTVRYFEIICPKLENY
jgi:hypothetical protein